MVNEIIKIKDLYKEMCLIMLSDPPKFFDSKETTPAAPIEEDPFGAITLNHPVGEMEKSFYLARTALGMGDFDFAAGLSLDVHKYAFKNLAINITQFTPEYAFKNLELAIKAHQLIRLIGEQTKSLHLPAVRHIVEESTRLNLDMKNMLEKAE